MKDWNQIISDANKNYTQRIYTDSTYNYICEAEVGAGESAAEWRIQRIDGSGNVTWADGDDNFDNIALDYQSLTYL